LPPTNRAIPDLWQAGMLLTGTDTVDSLCDVACVISDRAAADRIRARPEVVFAPVTVPPSSA
jgi:hypothetical protein